MPNQRLAMKRGPGVVGKSIPRYGEQSPSRECLARPEISRAGWDIDRRRTGGPCGLRGHRAGAGTASSNAAHYGFWRCFATQKTREAITRASTATTIMPPSLPPPM